MAKIDFAIVGVPKSATTFLHKVLQSHAGVSMEENENPLFNSPNWEPRLDQFLRRIDPADERIVGIKRPDMLFNIEAARRMKSHNPNIKALAVLRHPVERAVAHYYHLIKYNFLPLRDFASGIHDLLTGVLQRDWPRGSGVLDCSCYHDAIVGYMETLGRANVHIFTHDDVKEDASRVARAACEFLGLSSGAGVVLPKDRPQKVMYSLERLRFLRFVNEVSMELDGAGRGVKFKPQPLAAHESAWTYMIGQFDEHVMAQKFPNVPPSLDPSLWNLLYARFREDIVRVEELLGRALPAWHRNPLPPTGGG